MQTWQQGSILRLKKTTLNQKRYLNLPKRKEEHKKSDSEIKSERDIFITNKEIKLMFKKINQESSNLQEKIKMKKTKKNWISEATNKEILT